jgi:hypothetical protein
MEKCLKTLRFLNRHRDSILPLWKSKIITLRTKVSDISTRRGDWYFRIRWRDFTEVDLLEWTLVREELFSEFPSGIEFWFLSVVERSFERRRRSLKGKLFNLYSAYSGGFLLRMKPKLVMSERELRGNYLFPGKSSLVKKLSVETFKEPKASKPQRVRGYRDKGSGVDDSTSARREADLYGIESEYFLELRAFVLRAGSKAIKFLKDKLRTNE